MKSSNSKYQEIKDSFDEIFNFEDKQVQYEIDAKVLAAKFLSEVQEIVEQREIKRKELAEKIGTSASFLTQLFRGTKLMSFITAAKLQKALNIEFDISLVGKTDFVNPINENNIAAHLDKWYRDNKSEGYMKVVRNLSRPSASDYNYSRPRTLKNIAS